MWPHLLHVMLAEALVPMLHICPYDVLYDCLHTACSGCWPCWHPCSHD